jgi:DNA-binding response OmpR family regulator
VHKRIDSPAVRILLVEDSERVSALVAASLCSAGHDVVAESTCDGASKALAESRFDIAIVDIGLPDGSGLDLCRRARGDGLDLPILVLTARNGVADRVTGLDAGADDYLCKPFATAELHARVRALARRGPRWAESVRTFGALTIDRDRRVVHANELSVALTPREFDVLALLAWADGRVVARDHILEAVWGDIDERSAASLEVLVARIRRKLAAVDIEGAIRTVRSAGYAWDLPRSKPL